MTIWSPTLPPTGGPLYARIADQIEHDVADGVLVAGSRLPTHRELAGRLGITVVTVSRAYAEAAERGLIESNVGRGTFVRASRRAPRPSDVEIDLGTNVIELGELPPVRPLVERLVAALEIGYSAGAGTERHRTAGAKWIAERVADAGAERIVVTAGGQHAILASLAATARAGDVVYTEEVTYHGMKAAAALLHLRVEGLPTDRYGMVPDALEKALRKRAGKALYLTPTLHNPTGLVMPEKRRRDLAAVAVRHGIPIIEDDVYGFLDADAPPSIASMAPEQTIFLTGAGKSMLPSLRVGYVHAPEALIAKVQAAVGASMLFASPIGAEIAATWIEDGTARKLVEQKRAVIASRRKIARRILGDAGTSSPRAAHLWLPLPRRWNADAFADEARRQGVRVASASAFATTSEVPRAVRVSLGAAPSAAMLDQGLQIVAALCESDAASANPVV